MDFIQTIIISIVEGLTEFLPVSSTGHMIIAENLLGVDIQDKFVNAFTVIIQFGAILSVICLYWKRFFYPDAVKTGEKTYWKAMFDFYARRFSIHTMKLVGASWGFIRKPFIKRAVLVGVVAALLADGFLGGCLYAWSLHEPELVNVLGWQELAITGGSVFLFGIIITALCANISVNKFLKMKAGDLYKI